MKKLHGAWEVLNAQLAEHEFPLGSRFTVADLNIAAVMDLAYPAGIWLKDYPKKTLRGRYTCHHRSES